MSGTIPPGVPGGRDYALRGPQVEPTAAYWLTEKAITVPTLAMIRGYTEPKAPPAPGSLEARLAIDFAADFPETKAELDQQLGVLDALAQLRGTTPYPKAAAGFAITPLSRFLQLKPTPFGAIFDRCERTQPDIEDVTQQHLAMLVPTSAQPDTLTVYEGRELARMFEAETPGLYHRHALNWLLFGRGDVSPPRHARIWMALDMAIYTALSAAWHYKWVRERYGRLLRPSEYAKRAGKRLPVLFDRIVSKNGREKEEFGQRCPGGKGEEVSEAREFPCPSPGTPRHPAWPSGHSTYSAAASHLLEYFFSPDTLGEPDAELFKRYPGGRPNQAMIEDPVWIAAELRRLANNVGEARLWAGVHWLSDHVAGQKVGRAAAQAVVDAFEKDCTVPYKPPPPPLPPKEECDPAKLESPPSPEQLAADGPASRRHCKGNHDVIQPNPKRGRTLLSGRETSLALSTVRMASAMTPGSGGLWRGLASSGASTRLLRTTSSGDLPSSARWGRAL